MWISEAALRKRCSGRGHARIVPLVIAMMMAAPAVTHAQAISAETVESVLKGHGEWTSIQGLGRVWRPADVEVGGASFMPYLTGGRWVVTERGWYFAGSTSWGDVTFHYGRWWHDPLHDWVWVPGTVWAPAWVNWRYSEAAIGWSPLPPDGYYYDDAAMLDRWRFVQTRQILSTSLVDVLVPRELVSTTHREANLVGMPQLGQSWPHGPPVVNVATAIGHTIPVVAAASVPRSAPIAPPVRAAPVVAAKVSAPRRDDPPEDAPSKQGHHHHAGRQSNRDRPHGGVLTIAPPSKNTGVVTPDPSMPFGASRNDWNFREQTRRSFGAESTRPRMMPTPDMLE